MVSGVRFLGISLNSVNRSDVDKSELRLLAAAAGGDREARRALFEAYRDIAFRVAQRVCGREADALDAVQDAFIRAFERLGEFQGQASFKTWLLRIVTNRALDLVRARNVRLAVPLDGRSEDLGGPALPDGGAAPGDALERRELAVRLRQAIESLPPDQRSVFALYATGELTYGQIAEMLGIPLGTVMSRLFHARRRLHALLPDLAPEGRTEN
jgi:RNA polymerase sigma-70 factor (ECF subfamily)